jgi:hypothetical protein
MGMDRISVLPREPFFICFPSSNTSTDRSSPLPPRASLLRSVLPPPLRFIAQDSFTVDVPEDENKRYNKMGAGGKGPMEALGDKLTQPRSLVILTLVGEAVQVQSS